MKRTERRHLKENELQTFARDARERFEAKRRETLAIVAVVVVVGVAAVAYFGWRERVQTRAATMLADAAAVKEAQIGYSTIATGPLLAAAVLTGDEAGVRASVQERGRATFPVEVRGNDVYVDVTTTLNGVTPS